MPSLTGPLTQPYGMAAVNVEVALPYHEARRLVRSGATVPGPHRTSALLDSGSSFTLVDPAVVQALGLIPLNTTTIRTPHSGPNPPLNNLHRVDLTIPHPSGNPLNYLVRSRLTVVEADIAPLGYQVIIGTDVLSQLRFIYDGRHTPPSFMLSY
jgi:hypothetical protein